MAETLLVGGTGTLGHELMRQLGGDGAGVTVFSRDEFKQHEMRQLYPGAKYVIGDVRDKDAMRLAARGAETVFLLAAIKHIDAAERNPLEALKTNVLGSVNVAEAAMEAGAKHVVFSNTDKSVLPISTYGYTKAFAQNYLLSLNGSSNTRFCAFNWGNIVASRGSVVPLFVRSLLGQGSVKITDPKMSRFWISIEKSAAFMLAKYRDAPGDRALIPPVKGATVLRIAESVAAILNVKSYKVDITGLRCVEKFYEVLESNHAGCLRSDTCEQYSNEELIELLTPTVKAEEEACASIFTAARGTWGAAIVPSLSISGTTGKVKTLLRRRKPHLATVTP